MAMGMPRYEQGTHVTEVCGEKGFYFVSEISSIADLLYAFLHKRFEFWKFLIDLSEDETCILWFAVKLEVLLYNFSHIY